MLDDGAPMARVTLRIPSDILAAFDSLAEVLDRPRSWVMVRALRSYLKAEGAEISEDAAALAELDRGETIPAEEVIGEMRQIIMSAERKRPKSD
jgi:predicted transcriptional regulator